MRKLISALMLLTVLVSSFVLPAAAYGDVSGQAAGDSISWSIQGDTMYITGTGSMYDFPGSIPWVDSRSQVKKLVISDGIDYIGSHAFQDFDNLTEVEFGNSVTWLGEKSFYSCDSLTTLVMPASFRRFGAACLQSCKSLKSIYCLGNFPSFNDGCLWNDYVVVYYPSNNPWSDYYVQQLITNFKGRLDLIPYDMSGIRASSSSAPANNPAQSTGTAAQQTPAATTPTEAPLDSPIVFDRPLPTMETMPEQTVPTLSTEPVQTVPPTTVPVETVPPTTVPPTTVPVVTQAPTETEVFQIPTRATEPRNTAPATDGSSIIGVLIILVTLALLALAALLFQLSNRRHRRRRRRR